MDSAAQVASLDQDYLRSCLPDDIKILRYQVHIRQDYAAVQVFNSFPSYSPQGEQYVAVLLTVGVAEKHYAAHPYTILPEELAFYTRATSCVLDGKIDGLYIVEIHLESNLDHYLESLKTAYDKSFNLRFRNEIKQILAHE